MTITATTGPRPTQRRDEETAPPPPSRRVASPAPSRSAARQIDAGIVAAARNAKPAPSGPRGDGILYVGMNEASAAAEQAALRAVSSSVVAVVNTDRTVVDGHDVATDEGCDAFATALAGKNGMTSEAATRLALTLKATDGGARRELALVAAALAPGEHGKQIPSRIVLSGHSYSQDVHGKDTAHLTFASIRALGKAMPEAAKQIEDIHISGCNTGNQVEDHEAWQAAFPNLKTMWGYGGMAPGAPTGHLQMWEAATRGRSSADPARGQSLGVVETWSATKGIHTSISLDELRGRRDVADAAYDGLVRGEGTPGPMGAAKNPYETYREMAGRRSATPAERNDASAKAEVLLRVRFHASVGHAMTEAHGPEIHDAFASLGLPAPDFASLGRRDALAALSSFDAKLATTHPAPYAATATVPLLHGLRDLDPAVIPSSWCH